jgi:hypothetical protein
MELEKFNALPPMQRLRLIVRDLGWSAQHVEQVIHEKQSLTALSGAVASLKAAITKINEVVKDSEP